MAYINKKVNPIKPGKIGGKIQTIKFHSTDAPMYSSEDSPTYGENLTNSDISPEEATQQQERKKHLNDAINDIKNERERTIIKDRLLGDATLEDLSKKYGVSREAIRLAELRIKKKLADILKAKGLKKEDFE